VNYVRKHKFTYFMTSKTKYIFLNSNTFFNFYQAQTFVSPKKIIFRPIFYFYL